MSNTMLFVFEGEKTEPQIVKKIESFYFQDTTIIKAIYGNNLYNLYKLLKKDDTMDLLEVLKETNNNKASNKEELKDLEVDSVPEIYLFFDHDSHDSSYTPKKLKEMLEFFDEETENGKLYISYPMIESLKAIKNIEEITENCDKNCKYEVNLNKGYKSYINENSCIKDIRGYNKNIFDKISLFNFCKLNCIFKKEFKLPNHDKLRIYNQYKIFEIQIKTLEDTEEVVVLNAFPFFLIEYFKKENFYESLENLPLNEKSCCL